MQQLSLYIIY